jgi:hypothetical protein
MIYVPKKEKGEAKVSRNSCLPQICLQKLEIYLRKLNSARFRITFFQQSPGDIAGWVWENCDFVYFRGEEQQEEA